MPIWCARLGRQLLKRCWQQASIGTLPLPYPSRVTFAGGGRMRDTAKIPIWSLNWRWRSLKAWQTPIWGARG